MYISIHARLKKAFALLAIFAMVGTSVPVGALTAFAEGEVLETETVEVATPAEEVVSAPEVPSEETDETIVDVDSATPVVEEEVLEATSSSDDSEESTGFVIDANGVATIDTVALGVTYTAPQNDQVKVTFTRLPEAPGSLSIQEVLLTDEQVAQLGALSNIAYDITSNMENGTFAYDLVLPLPEGAEENAQVVFAETAADLTTGDIETIATEKLDVATGEQTVEISELNHFTIFVVTSFEEPQTTPPSSGYNNMWTAYGFGATVTQTPTGTDGITSSEGDNHAVIKTSAYTDWDGRKSEFPEGGYDTRVDVYVDMSLSTGGLLTKRMAYSSAINDQSGDHLRDFVFHLGTKAFSSGKWVVSASDNVIDLPGNPFHSPVTLNTTGWYTLEHQFRDVGGVLEVTLNIYKKGESSPVGSWTLSDSSDDIDSTVGGNRYGWFVDTGVLNRFNKIAIDASEIEYATVAAPSVRPSLEGETIYDAIPAVLPSNLPSQPYQAQATSEFGDEITFEPGTGRALLDGAITLSSWACESGEWHLGTCETTPGATFDHPITLTLYTVAGDGSVGAPIASRTQTFAIPYRPSANVTCSDPKQWKDTNGNCFNGYNYVVVFDLSGIVVPDSVIFGVAYNTNTYGEVPEGETGPYDSLNVSLNTDTSAPYIGTDVDTNEMFWDATYLGRPAGFTSDLGWSAYRIAAAFTAVALPHNNNVVEVNWSQMNGWSPATTGNGVVDFVPAASSQIGDEALRLTTESDNNDRAAIARTENVDLADVTTLKYSTKRSAGFLLEGNASYRVRIDADGDLSTTNDTAYLIHEPYWQNGMSPDPAPNALDVWQTWDVASGFFWASIPGGNAISGLTNGAGGPPFYTIQDVLTLHPNAKVIGINIGIGSYNTNYDILVDAVVFGYKTDSSFETTTYDFTVDTVPPETPAGLRYDNPAIACGGFTNINYTYPKWDVVVDAVSYDYQALFGASVVYSTNFTTNAHPGGTFGGGQNGVWGFQVRSVDASGLKSAWSPVCEITLDTVAPAAPVHVSPLDDSTQYGNDFYFDWTDVADVVEYEFQSSQDSTVDGNGALVNGVWNNKVSGAPDRDFLSDSAIHSYGANGTWYWQVRAIDAAGNKSSWTMPWKMTIDLDGPDPVEDTTAPAVPTGLAWTDSNSNNVPDGGITALYAGTASWSANEEVDFDHYVYKYWNDIDGSVYRDEATSWPAVTGGTSLGGVFNQGEGVHHFCIVAVDTSGNASACSTPFTITYDISDENEGGNDDDLAPITVCKFVDEVPQAGWGMTLSSWGEASPISTTTDSTGCVTVSVDLTEGPWTVVEEDRVGYTQNAVEASQGSVSSVGESDLEMCMFGLPGKQTFNLLESNESAVYSCTFYNSQDVVENPETPEASNTSSTRFGSRSSSRPDGQVLGASTSIEDEGDFCVEPYITDNLGYGRENNAAQVIRLQKFLNDHMSTTLAVDGLFELATQEAVMNFQLRYASEILTPWGISNPTGFVYYTTKKKINELVCEREFPLTQAQLDEINRVKNQIAGGITTLGTPQETVAGAATGSSDDTNTSDDTSSSSTADEGKTDEEEEQGFFGRLWNSIFGN